MSCPVPAASPAPTPVGETSLSRTCVIVRMFDEGTVIEGVIRELRDSFPLVLAVDDGSHDRSSELASSAGAQVLRHPINLGAGAALQTGLEAALTLPGVDYILTFDGDGQHRIQDAIALVEAARTTEADVVLGSRFLEHPRDIPVSRRLLLRCATFFTRATTHLPVTDAHCGLRLLTRASAEKVRLRLRGMAYASELIRIVRSQRLSVHEIPVQVRYTDYSRAKGQRNINALNIAFDLLMTSLRAST